MRDKEVSSGVKSVTINGEEPVSYTHLDVYKRQMRGFMSVPCDVYFTMDAKISRFLDCSLKLYDVPKEKQMCIRDREVGWRSGWKTMPE